MSATQELAFSRSLIPYGDVFGIQSLKHTRSGPDWGRRCLVYDQLRYGVVPSMSQPEVPGGKSRSLIPPMVYQTKEEESLSDVLRRAGKRALGGGIPGAAAMGIQVLSLMWLRTTVNYQYRYGTTTTEALKTLYKEGGIRRFYRGVGPALLQGPLSRFGDTAANAGVLAFMDHHESTKNLPVAIKTIAASGAAGLFRIFLMPIDALKTIMQVEGKNGLPALMNKVKANGPGVLYHGAIAASAATFAGHYPWFATYNYLNHTLPVYDELHKKLMRAAFIGFCASAISDTVSNSIRVVKTTKQTATTPMTYPQVVRVCGVFSEMFMRLMIAYFCPRKAYMFLIIFAFKPSLLY